MSAVLAKSFFGDGGKELEDHLQSKGYDLSGMFGTIPRSMATLIGFTTFDNTISLQRAIGEIYPVAWIFFVIFMVVLSIGMMELMTSLFIESLLEEKRKMEKLQTEEKLFARKKVEDLLAALFSNFDDDDNGELDEDELKNCMQVFEDRDTRELMDYVGIDSVMMAEAIKVADIDADGTVSEQEFRTALESTSSAPVKADIRAVHQRVAQLTKKHVEDMAKMSADIKELKDILLKRH